MTGFFWSMCVYRYVCRFAKNKINRMEIIIKQMFDLARDREVVSLCVCDVLMNRVCIELLYIKIGWYTKTKGEKV